MAKVSMLERMRIARDQREQAAIDPVRRPMLHTMARQDAEIRDLKEVLDGLTSLVTAQIGPHVFAKIADRAANEMYPAVHAAMMIAGRRGPYTTSVVTVEVPSAALCFLRPDEAMKTILDAAARHTTKKMNVRALPLSADYAMQVRVTIPHLEVGVVVPREQLERKGRVA